LVLILPGAPAGSAFRRARQLERLQRIDAGILALHSRFVHFVDCRVAPDVSHAVLDDLRRASVLTCLNQGTYSVNR